MQTITKLFESLYYPTYLYGKMRSYAQPYLSTNVSINEIVPGLYLGDFASACNKDVLKKMEFTHIVTAILGVNEMYPDDFRYLTLPLRDVRSETIFTTFRDSSEFIQNALDEGGKVLIHCIAGVSRSATLVAAYLIKEYGLDSNSAIKFIQQKRNIVNPNSGFKEQLDRYDAILHGKKVRRRSV